MTKLSVNINKIATLRNARGGNYPDLLQATKDIQRFGADGITVHPRPDERHIRKSDVYALKEVITTEFNIEGFPGEDFLKLISEVRPAQATLVPDSPHVITSNAGWDTLHQKEFLKKIITRIKDLGIRVSIFMAPDTELIRHAAETGTDRIELFTEAYASAFETDPESAVSSYAQAAAIASEFHLGINAGHDLNLKNLRFFRQQVPGLLEVSIGHALISDALYFGLENTVAMYQRQLNSG